MNVSEAAAKEAGEREPGPGVLADPTKDFFYLAGPMTNIPQFNYPAFDDAAEVLRVHGYNIITPSELDDAETRAAALASPDGAPGSGSVHNGTTHTDLLERDIKIVSDPNCVGIICIDGWEQSRGASVETTVAAMLHRPVHVLTIEGNAPMLTRVEIPDPAKPLAGSAEAERTPSLAEKAVGLVHGDRGKEYGHPIEDFSRSALIFTAILSKDLKPGHVVRPDQIPLLLIGVKLSRLVQSPYHEDSLADIHGYGLTAEMVWDKQREYDDLADIVKKIAEAG